MCKHCTNFKHYQEVLQSVNNGVNKRVNTYLSDIALKWPSAVRRPAQQRRTTLERRRCRARAARGGRLRPAPHERRTLHEHPRGQRKRRRQEKLCVVAAVE